MRASTSLSLTEPCHTERSRSVTRQCLEKLRFLEMPITHCPLPQHSLNHNNHKDNAAHQSNGSAKSGDRHSRPFSGGFGMGFMAIGFACRISNSASDRITKNKNHLPHSINCWLPGG